MLKPLTFVLSDDPRAALCWRDALALLLGVVSWLALMPAPPNMTDLLWDKLNHLLAFTSLALVGYFAFQPHWLRLALALLAYGGLIEILQARTATRVGDWFDLLADAAGITLGLLLAALLARLVRGPAQPR